MQTLVADGITHWLEIGRHPVLLPAVDQCLGERAAAHATFTSLRRGHDGQITVLSTRARYASGLPLDWRRIQSKDGQAVDLPTYPFQRTHYWFERAGGEVTQPTASSIHGPFVHPLLGSRLDCAAHAVVFERTFEPPSLAFLADHRVFGSVVLPAAVYAEMGLATGTALLRTRPLVIEDLSIRRRLTLSNGPSRVQVIAAPQDGERLSFEIFSRRTDASASTSPWTLHATGRVVAAAAEENRPRVNVEELRARCGRESAVDDRYRTFDRKGIQYGPSFQSLRRVFCGAEEVLAEIELPNAVAAGSLDYHLHPVLLDGCFQALDALAAPDVTYLPVAIRRLSVLRDAGTSVWVHGRVRADALGAGHPLEVDLDMFTSDGTRVGSLEGLELRATSHDAFAQTRPPLDECLYEIVWRPQARANPAADYLPPVPAVEAGLATAMAQQSATAEVRESSSCVDPSIRSAPDTCSTRSRRLGGPSRSANASRRPRLPTRSASSHSSIGCSRDCSRFSLKTIFCVAPTGRWQVTARLRDVERPYLCRRTAWRRGGSERRTSASRSMRTEAR